MENEQKNLVFDKKGFLDSSPQVQSQEPPCSLSVPTTPPSGIKLTCTLGEFPCSRWSQQYMDLHTMGSRRPCSSLLQEMLERQERLERLRQYPSQAKRAPRVLHHPQETWDMCCHTLSSWPPPKKPQIGLLPPEIAAWEFLDTPSFLRDAYSILACMETW